MHSKLNYSHCKMAEKEQFVEEVSEEEEDPVDPQDELKEKCAELSTCSKLKDLLDGCTESVESGESKKADCVQELFNFIHCVDHCVSKNLMQKLK